MERNFDPLFLRFGPLALPILLLAETPEWDLALIPIFEA